VPIVTADSVAGRIYLTEKHGGVPFTAEDEQLVETLASQAAIAIDNVSLNERLHETAEALEEASRHKSTFLANMSHELRSPLNTIIGYTRLLLEDSDGLNEEQIEDLRIVRGSGEHLLVLITDLLDLQRIEAGRVTLVLDDEQLRPLLDWVVASVLPSVSKNVELVLEADALGDDAIRCDRTRVRQMLLNVIGNALKFTQSGSVRVIARGDEHEIRIDVVDTGPGIPRGDQARIFESFYQSTAAADKTPGPREGAGLGLAITRMLVELHGGSVTLESTEGVGTTVRIRLPRDAGSSMTEGRDA
jgi:signal transduction histidine kinase